MKKLWNANLTSTLSNLSTTAVSGISAGASQLQQRLAPVAPAAAPAAEATPAAVQPSEKQYLRLPIESARKLRWYDKGDVAAVVRTHAREKRELQDTVTALKKLLIKAGYTEATIDEETRQLLMSAQHLKESDEGVHTTLAVAAQCEIQVLNERVAELETQLRALHAKQSQSRRISRYSITDEGEEQLDSAAPSLASSRAPTPLPGDVDTAEAVRKLMACLAELDSADSNVHSVMQQVRQHELEVQKEAMRAALMTSMPSPEPSAADIASGVDPAGSTEHVKKLMTKVQRLELERLATMEELAEAQGQAALLPATQQAADVLRGQLAEAEQQSAQAQAAVEQLQEELTVAREKLRSAEELSERRAQELRSKSAAAAPSADLLNKYQDACVEAEERAAAAERRSTLAEARVGKLEVALRDAQADVRNLRLQVKESEAKVAAAAVAAAGVSKVKQEESDSSRHMADAARQLETEKQLLREEREQMQAEVRVLKEQLTRNEARLRQAEQREGRLMAEVREAEAVAAERDELAAQVQALREHLESSRAERGQLQHFKQMARELEEGRLRMEGELVTTAQIVTALEARLREANQNADSAHVAAEMAMKRVKAAEAAVTKEVEQRLQSAGTNRSLWPTAILREVQRLEARAEALQSALSVVQQEMEKETRARQTEAHNRVEAQRQVLEMEDRLRATESSSRERVQHLEASLEMSQQDADAARQVILKLEQEMDELAMHQQQQVLMTRNISRASSGASLASAASTPLPLKVGGGSLYGISDIDTPPHHSPHHHHTNGGGGGSNGGAPGVGSPGPSTRDKLGGLDVVYLKNVLMKFIEAVVLGKGPERDSLLPAVATLLQASPGEYRLLKQLTQNTTGTAGLLNALGYLAAR